ncbi:MAG: SDR family NAD(P)-dependent oxidoreductase [Clostridia bacterium]|nr:SDR family NAD(P)-dependent oxidoreductase [Clostridia bacterium]
MKIGLITGASSGMGYDFARLLDKEELDELWVVARRADRLEQLKTQCKTPVRVIAADLTKQEGIVQIADCLQAHEPRISYLVNCAGFGKFGDYTEISLENQLSMIDLNVKALVSVTQMALGYMDRGDRIIQLCSSSAFFPLPYLNVYASTKAFVQHYSYGLAEELKPRGITVTQVSPGWVQTEFFDGSQNDTSIHAPKKYSPMYRSEQVVSQAIRDAKKGKSISVCGTFVKFHRLAGRFAPRWFMKSQWRARLK